MTDSDMSDSEIFTRAMLSLQGQDLAQPWAFEGKSGYRMTPHNAGEVAYLLNWCQSQGYSLALSAAHAARMPNSLWLDMSGVSQISRHWADDFMIEVESGISMGRLASFLKPFNQSFALNYPPEALLLDILAEDRAALETGLAGYPRDFVLKIEIATPDGQLSITGADVVKNVSGYDLAKLYVGAHHSLGVITTVTLKIVSLLSGTRRHYGIYTTDSHAQACALAITLLDSNLPLEFCEIYHWEGQPWHIFMAFSSHSSDIGLEWETIQPQLAFLTQGTPFHLSLEEALLLGQQLQRHSPDMTVLEVALPNNQWSVFSGLLGRQSALKGMRIQIRAMAGLLYLSMPFLSLSVFRFLQHEVQQVGGTLQVLQLSQTDMNTMGQDPQDLFAEINLPRDPIIRSLLKDLKTSYDPDGILFTPTLPLQVIC